jgi:thiosulfate dehydrogenase [quinone] large subunit
MSFNDENRSDFVIAYALARVGFGINLFTHGLSRIGAIPAFEESLRNMFSKTWIPLPLVTAAGYAIPPIELTIGALIILGLLLRPALTIGMLLMWLLTFGTCLLQQWSVASEQLIYMVFYAGLIACARFNGLSLDTLRKPLTPGQS